MARRRQSPRSAAAPPPAGGTGGLAYGRFLLNLLLAAVPVVVVWVALTPFIDNFLRVAGESLVQLTEVPNVTELLSAAADPHYAVIHRLDFPPARANVTTFRVTDVHFHLVLLGMLFLAVPGVPFRRRLANLGQAALVLLAFDVVLVLLWVKFTYATQLGAWSVEHYGPFARNAWGLAKHVADLPIKLALPFALWAGFYLRLLLPRRAGSAAGSGPSA